MMKGKTNLSDAGDAAFKGGFAKRKRDYLALSRILQIAVMSFAPVL